MAVMTPAERAAYLETAIRHVIDGDYPKTVAKQWAKDGKPSKHDQCPHALYFWEGCEECICDFLRGVLRCANNG
jgi:hypothetical protein